MIPVLWKSTLRWPLRRPWQALLAIIGVAMGVAVVIAIDIANESARRAFLASTESISGKATEQLIGGPEGIPEAFFVTLRRDVGIRQSAPLIEGYAVTTDKPTRTLTILGIDPFSEAAFRPAMAAAGTPLRNGMAALLTQPGSVILGAKTAAALKVAPGGRVAVRIAGSEHQMQVVAVLEAAEGSPNAALDDVVLTDIGTAQEW
ncbi:MAG: hypothetical protein RLY87_1341, partial [Chloroflexota bacterium]